MAVSYFSMALLTLQEQGIEPMYLYHMFEDLRNQPVFKEVTSILEGWGYKFPSGFSDIHSGFKSELSFGEFDRDAVSLPDLVGERNQPTN